MEEKQNDGIAEMLEYWESPMMGAMGDDAVSDGHADHRRAMAVELIRNGGPWDEEILGPRPTFMPSEWERIKR